MANNFPNTGSTIQGQGDANPMSSGLSTQIVIKVNGVSVGALQRLSVAQNRPLYRVNEIGTDGTIEIVPQSATTFELTAERIVFDQLRLPESFSKGFRFINAQRLPFDIEIIDFSGTASNADLAEDSTGIVAMTYRSCWFTRYDTPYAADNYIITETATLWCETAYITTPTAPGEDGSINSGGPRGLSPYMDVAGVESAVNFGNRRGSMDAAGILSAIFPTQEE